MLEEPNLEVLRLRRDQRLSLGTAWVHASLDVGRNGLRKRRPKVRRWLRSHEKQEFEDNVGPEKTWTGAGELGRCSIPCYCQIP